MKPYKHLSLEERKVIQKMLWRQEKVSIIAQFLKRSISTISREVAKNKSSDGFYRAMNAHKMYFSRRSYSRGSKIENNPDILLYIIEKMLLYKWSPEYIAGRLAIEYAENNSLRISYESIYIWLYKLYRDHNITLWKYLPRKRGKRRKREYIKQPRVIIKDKKSIHTRPKEANERKNIGHWEGDTIVGKNHDGYIVTLVDKKSLYLAASKMNDGKSETCMRAIFEAFGDIQNEKLQTITFDNGSEFAAFKTLEEACECKVYFADPYSAWQRGLNEQTNGLIRRFLPKGTSFKDLDDKKLEKIVWKINTMPRKVLNFYTPYEVFHSLALQN